MMKVTVKKLPPKQENPHETTNDTTMKDTKDTKIDRIDPPVTIAVVNNTFTTNLTSLADQIAPIPLCGLTSLPLYSGCCIQMTFDVPVPYSFERHFLGFIGTDEYPESSKGSKYCQLKSTDSGQTFGYEQVSYLDNNQCVDDYYKCNGNIFSVYSEVGCNGNQESIYIPDGGTFNINIYGNVSISVIQPDNASMQIYWTTPNLFEGIPQHLEGYLPIEIFGIICAALSIGLFALTFMVYAFRFWQVPTYTNIWLALTQLIWIGRSFMTVMNNYYQADTPLGQHLLSGFWSLSCIGTYMSVMISSNMIIRLFNWEQNLKISFAIYGAITVMSTILGGPTYLYFVIYFTENIPFMYDFYTYSVDEMYFGWELFMFIFDIIPPVIYLFKMKEINTTKLKSNQTELFYSWRKLTVVFLLIEMLNISSYVGVFYLQYYSFALGGDLQYESVWMILLLNYCIHNIVILSMFECLKEMMKVTVKSSSKKEKIVQAGSSTVKDTRVIAI
ncbi:hypothetical protein HDV06_001428 [Boothiomyces sp. JEL0866]|nr:hypothetical protein HDV06_001428 [Boothiomyces sp. JEL0866]